MTATNTTHSVVPVVVPILIAVPVRIIVRIGDAVMTVVRAVLPRAVRDPKWDVMTTVALAVRRRMVLAARVRKWAGVVTVVPAARLRVVRVARMATSVRREAIILHTLAMTVVRVMTIIVLLTIGVTIVGVTIVVLPLRHTLDTIATRDRAIRDSVPIMVRNTPTVVRMAMVLMVGPVRTSAAGWDAMINGVTGGRRHSFANGWLTDLAVHLSVPHDLPRHTVSNSAVEWDRADSAVPSVGPPSRAVT